jgi:hypothetical protein
MLSAGLVLSGADVSWAQPVDAAARATARQLGAEGMKLYDKGDFSEAAEKLTRAHDLVHVPTLAFYAGKCLEKLGRLVEASERYLDATRDTVEAGAPPAQRTAQADAERARQALLPRLASVEIVLQPFAPDAAITLDGKPLPAAMLGVKRPIDPGDHEIVVLRAGIQTPRKVTLKEGESMRVEIDVPAVPVYPYAPMYPPGAVPYGYPPTYAPRSPVPPTRRYNTGLFAGGLVLIPLGSVGFLAGAVMLGEGGSTRTAGAVILTLGVLAVGGGIPMTVIGGKRVPDTSAPAKAFLEPFVGPTSAGLRGRF